MSITRKGQKSLSGFARTVDPYGNAAFSENPESTKAREIFAAICLRNKAFPLQDERNKGI